MELFNTLHTSLEKTVSHKTRYERAQFLRRFFRDLKAKAGFNTIPDPRNLGQKHIHAMVQVWQKEHLAPATIQTYLSFLRGLGMWMGKHGFGLDGFEVDAPQWRDDPGGYLAGTLGRQRG
ncbi:MAG: phage integrase N-terminal domain-containing protein [Burkholderiales bacterium]